MDLSLVSNISPYRETPPEKDLRQPLSHDETADLLSFLKYYDRRITEDAVYNLYCRDKTPLYDHWESQEAFFFVYDTFKQLANECSEEEFFTSVINESVPEKSSLNRTQREFIKDFALFRREARSLNCFFNSMKEYFDYEILLISLGYPCSHSAA